MVPKRYPNLRRAQQERGPFYRGPRPSTRRQSHFPLIVAALSAALFASILWGERMPELLASIVRLQRDLGRDHAPPPGAYYSGCNDARAAGVAPIYRGEPGYRPEMDGDDDGIACEPWRGR
jgi:hypothetical protein